MWSVKTKSLPAHHGLQHQVHINGRAAMFVDVIRGWQEDATFRVFFNALLANAPYSAFRWETPAVTSSTVMREFEFVLLNSPGLARPPDPNAFAAQFANAADGIGVFPNLGKDATMVVPAPLADDGAYGHLAAFVRTAPETQREALWRAVGNALQARLNSKPVWLSTAGAGVSWLHVRLDDRPKYYGFAEYRRTPAQ